MKSSNYLLDTHVLVWSQSDPDKLSKKVRDLLLNEEAKLFLSTISTLEIARLVALGQIEIGTTVNQYLAQIITSLSLDTVQLTHEIALEAYNLPGEFHPDPADRVLVATARCDNLILITADRRLLDYRYVRCMCAN